MRSKNQACTPLWGCADYIWTLTKINLDRNTPIPWRLLASRPVSTWSAFLAFLTLCARLRVALLELPPALHRPALAILRFPFQLLLRTIVRCSQMRKT